MLFEELKDCLEDFSGVDGDRLGEGEEISFGELDESGIEGELWLGAEEVAV